ncbi:putative late blight resistance protein homolog R1A-10 [Lycium ferocissimum]|uniref:putative late blight resistance protein homolog R1A-10 n=1 Tax=Lycium ferocissimum TaxID=112874 RepID=UPI0028155486|nr:putative late blight resistance protein homolog R1A-10 [Lycium ferocissimum]
MIGNAVRAVAPQKTMKMLTPSRILTSQLSDPLDFFITRRYSNIQDRVIREGEEVVGFDEEAEIVMKRLVEVSKDGDIVPIVGMLGLGKTTLATKIYRDDRISKEYLSTIWIHVGQSFKLKDICLSILQQLKRLIEEYEDMDVSELAKIICGFLAEGVGRCLIVLDDVWTLQVVDFFKGSIFPENNKSHRVLMTTRVGSVATYANEDPHHLKFLTPDESFKILLKGVFGEESPHDELLESGKSIAGKCRGIPGLTLVVAEGLKSRHTKRDWREFEKKMWEHVTDKQYPDRMYYLVKTSYDFLTEEMKLCFLYFGVFPQGFDIPAWKLIRLWIAECLIKPNSWSSLEERAKSCLNSLVDMNLVMVTQKSSDGGHIKTCRVHDFLHEFCKLKAKDWLFQEAYRWGPIQSKIKSIIPRIARRLYIQSSEAKDFLSTKPLMEHVRSFYCFSSEKSRMELSSYELKSRDKLPGSGIAKAFPLIRVLEIESLYFVFSKDFNKLFHLKYIAISSDFDVLPESFGKFWNLQTLILHTRTSKPTLKIEANMWKLARLRHLHTNIPAVLPPPPIATSEASSLQTLSIVAPRTCTKDVFAKSCNIKKLGIRGNMEVLFGTSKNGWRSLEELKCLENLKLLNDVLHMSKALHLPPSFFSFLGSLKKLSLEDTRFDWDEARILGQLECLEVLKLIENAFTGESWKPQIGGFSQLQVLRINEADLKFWEAST